MNSINLRDQMGLYGYIPDSVIRESLANKGRKPLIIDTSDVNCPDCTSAFEPMGFKPRPRFSPLYRPYCRVETFSMNVSFAKFVTYEGGIGLLTCETDCGKVCYRFKYECLGGGFDALPSVITGTINHEEGTWRGGNDNDIAGRFPGFATQYSAGYGIGGEGRSGSLMMGPGGSSKTSGGAAGFGAGVAVTGCYTYSFEEVPCDISFGELINRSRNF
jgi:hypothetical protein